MEPLSVENHYTYTFQVLENVLLSLVLLLLQLLVQFSGQYRRNNAGKLPPN